MSSEEPRDLRPLVLALAHRGVSMREIASRLGVEPATVHRWRNMQKLAAEHARRSVLDSEEEE